MARQARHPLDNGIYQVLNRGNCRMNLFEKAGDFQSFIKLLEEGRQRCSMRILGYCLMDNHWHLILERSKAASGGGFVTIHGVGLHHARPMWCPPSHFPVRMKQIGNLIGV